MSEMLKNALKHIIFATNAIIAASPFLLIIYLFKTWVDHGDIASISLAHALYHWLGINPAINNVPYDLAGLYTLYVYLLKLPLLLWLFILGIPSFLYVYRNIGD